MADKSNWYDFLIPSEDTRKAIEENLEEGQLYSRIIGEEGIDGLLTRLKRRGTIKRRSICGRGKEKN